MAELLSLQDQLSVWLWIDPGRFRATFWLHRPPEQVLQPLRDDWSHDLDSPRIRNDSLAEMTRTALSAPVSYRIPTLLTDVCSHLSCHSNHGSFLQKYPNLPPPSFRVRDGAFQLTPCISLLQTAPVPTTGIRDLGPPALTMIVVQVLKPRHNFGREKRQ